MGKELACNAGVMGWIPGSERSPGGENINPLQYSCLEISMDRGAWWTREFMGHKELDTIEHIQIPWMEEPGRLQSRGSIRVGHD